MNISDFSGLFDLFEDANFELYLVGGSVRDLLLEVPEPKDFDFATNAVPSQIKEVLRRGELKIIPIGERFGTIKTFCNGLDVEITTYRTKETYTSGSRHPQVQFGDSLEDDLVRRDLTINAIAMKRDGSLVDRFNGSSDIKKGILRTPGINYEKTVGILNDDPLRILRVARFSSVLGFKVASEVTAASKAVRQGILNISRERWRGEFDKILASKEPSRGLRWLEEIGVLSLILKEVEMLTHMLTDQERSLFETQFSYAQSPSSRWQLLDRVCQTLVPDSLLRWSALLLVAFLPMSALSSGEMLKEAGEKALQHWEQISVRYKFSKRDYLQVRVLLGEIWSLWFFLSGCTDADLRRFYDRAGEYSKESLDFAAGVIPLLSKSGTAVAANILRISSRIKVLQQQGNLVPKLPKGLGSEIIKELGLIPGPDVGDFINRIREAILDGILKNGKNIEYYVERISDL